MSSLTRRMQRKFKRKNGLVEVKPDLYKDCGSYYKTYHPTKGWRRVNFKRVWAAQRTALLKGY